MALRSEGGIGDLLSRHGPKDVSKDLDAESIRTLSENGSVPVEAAVVVGDLRMSGLLLKEAVSASLFARYIVGFTEAVRSLSNEFDGWFDKFTGDGFITFWLRPHEESVVQALPEFCRSVIPASESLITNLKRNSRNFPVGVGLALGIDSGACELVRVGNSITILGSPIVGATRMVSGARPGRALVNVGMGSVFEEQRSRLESMGMRIDRSVVATKEYPEGQEAYEMDFHPATETT